ncbi:DUF11 domain-containing protein [Psychromicrobium xiongbiense]|uniref:DUF11 domain-containing protein n=1 Tax=Psychromicrobium xiongbiense TaxID=3051184 RepID=UPI002553E1BC|nr:DUF11 domain-containing protein [Psychromicrobium sp. YIM S02556]
MALVGGERWRQLAVLITVPLTVISLVLGIAAPVSAAGSAQVTVNVVAVDAATGTPISSVTSSQAPRRIAYAVDFSCVSANCDGATVKFDPTQLDPSYNTRLLFKTGFTPPVGVAASLSGSDGAGWTVNLGNLLAGQSGQFTLEYGWQGPNNSFDPNAWTYAIFPDGFQIAQTVHAAASTASVVHDATTQPVTWHIPLPNPMIAGTDLATPGSGYFTTDTNISYRVHMATGCKSDGDNVTYDYQCSTAFTVTNQLPKGAVFVAAEGNPIVTGDPSTGLILTWNSAGTSFYGWAGYAPWVNFKFPRANVAPAGQSCNFTTSFMGPSGTVDTTYITLPGTTATQKSASFAPAGPFPLKCSDPFPRAEMDPKQSTYDGAWRPTTADATVVIPTSGANLKQWQVTVANTANIWGVATVMDNTLDLPDLPVYQIAAPSGSTIVWTATDGTTTQSGTSTTTANAPAGFRFVTSTVTSPRLAPPNTIPDEHYRTTFTVAYRYKVTPDATNPTFRRINRASATMSWPDNPQFPDTVLGPTSGAVTLIAPFGKIDAAKGAYMSDGAGSAVGGTTGPSGAVDLTIPTANRAFWWNAWVYNEGNAPAIASVTDNGLNDPDLPITSITALTWSQGGGCCGGINANWQYTLDDGTAGTASNVQQISAPTGRRFATVTATTVTPITGGSTVPGDGGWNSFVLSASGLLGPTATPDTLHKNSFTGSLDYSSFSVPNLTTGATATVHLVGPSPVVGAAFGPTQVAGGATQATPTTDVTFTLGGGTQQVPLTRDITPEYVFMAPAGWNITPGSASFPAGAVPPGVQFQYRTVTVSGVVRQVVVATWPAGTFFGKNSGLPFLSVITRPGPGVAAGTAGTPRGFITNTAAPQAGDQFSNEFTDTPDIDGNPATTRFSETAPSGSVPVGAVAAMQVLTEICFPDATQADGCRWYADSSNKVGVAPNTTAIKYRLTVTNTGNKTLSDVVGYDVLPYVGDTGTSDPTASTPRGSTFRETLQSVTAPTNLAVATYSAVTQPCRPEVSSLTPPNCTNDWGPTVVGANAIRLARAGSLAPGESFSMQYTAAVAGNPSNGAIACSSFAVKATGLSLASEPAPVCASIEEADLQIVAGTPQLQVGRPGVLPWTVTNLGGAPSTQGEVKVTIPSGLQVTSFTPAGWVCTAVDGSNAPVYGTAIGPATLTCVPNNPLLKNVSQQLTIPAQATAATALAIPAHVSGRMYDSNLSNNDAQMSVTPVAAASGIGITKTDGVSTAKPGDTLTYTITVTNPLAFETLKATTLVDTLPPQLTFVSASDGGTASSGVVTWALPDLAPNASISRTVTVTVPSTISLAQLTNGATVTAPDPANANQTLTGSATDVDTVITNPAITLKKSVSLGTFAAVGEVLSYSFALKNTGDVTLNGVALTDPLAGLSAPALTWPGAAGVLAPGQTATGTATYTVTQADLDRGRIDNTATVTGNPPAGNPVTASSSAAVTSTAMPHLHLTKAAAGTVTKAGDAITYTFTVLNDGPVSLMNVTVTDPLPGLSTLSYTWPGAAGELAPGQSATATATYQVTQADVDRSSVDNTATATGLTPYGVQAEPVIASASVPITPAPAITVKKSADRETVGKAGDVINYSFLVTNTGNVTLSGIGVDETAFSGKGTLPQAVCPADTLAPGASETCVTSYPVTQADIDASAVSNTAVAHGFAPRGEVPIRSLESTVTVTAPMDPSLTLVKSADLSNATQFVVGKVITYSFVVTNTGNVTLTNLGVDEGQFTGSKTLAGVVCPPGAASLAPGAQLVCTTSYTVTQADVDQRGITNTATAHGTPPRAEGSISSKPSTVILPGEVKPALSLVKTPSVPKVTDAGQIITYTFTVTNTGNVSVAGPGVAEGSFTGRGTLGSVACPTTPTVLLPGQTLVCTATYTVVDSDLTGNDLVNTATATGSAPDGSPVSSAPSSARVATMAPPLAITGASNPWSIAALGALLLLTGFLLVGAGRRRRNRSRWSVTR